MSVLIAGAADAALRVCRMPGLNSPRVYAMLGAPAWQGIAARVARRRAVAAYRRAAAGCPGYAAFLREQGFAGPVGFASFSTVPETTKQNYVKKHSIEERCMGGRIPARGVVIDESSGSSGAPNNWVRGPEERAGVRRMLNHRSFCACSWLQGRRALPGELLRARAVGDGDERLDGAGRDGDSEVGGAGQGQAGEHPAAVRGAVQVRHRGVSAVRQGFSGFNNADLSEYELHLLVGGEGITEALQRTGSWACSRVCIPRMGHRTWRSTSGPRRR